MFSIWKLYIWRNIYYTKVEDKLSSYIVQPSRLLISGTDSPLSKTIPRLNKYSIPALQKLGRVTSAVPMHDAFLLFR